MLFKFIRNVLYGEDLETSSLAIYYSTRYKQWCAVSPDGQFVSPDFTKATTWLEDYLKTPRNIYND